MIVRELLTAVGYKVDRKSEQGAKASFDKLRAAAASLGVALSAGAVAVGFKKAIDAASDVEETLNVVTTAFEDQADAVLQWAQESGDAAGRSQFAMREYASQLGAVVGPTLGSAEATADLSTNMAQLAVDLGSFFNATDEEALGALRAGLIGSSEPLLRFGVNMNVAALDAFALSEGIGKTTKQMNEAEKTQLRYRFIMARTTKAQGDAAKTSGGFANQTKRLQGNIRDLAVGIGKIFLPAAAGTLQSINAIAKQIQGPLIVGVRSVVNVFKLLGAVLIGLWQAFMDLGTGAKIALMTALFFTLAFLAPWILMPALIGAAVAGAILILDDLWKALSTGEGVLAGLMGEFEYQLGETESWSAALGQILKTSVDFWGELFFGFGDTTEGIFAWIGSIWDGFADTVGIVGDKVGIAVRDLIVLFGEITDVVTRFVTGGIEKAIDLATKFFGTVGDLDKFFGLIEPTRLAVPGSPAAGGGGNVNAQQTIEVNVNAPGGDGAGIAAAVAPAVGRAAGDANRRTAQQLLLGGAS